MFTNRAYDLSPYDPTWPYQFEQLATRLRAVLGPMALTIEHVGSTSIPGTLAKPQIDISVTVADLATVPAFYEAMQTAGFTPRGDYTGIGEEYFTVDHDGQRLASVHILADGHPEAVEMIQFRDYLRAHPAERDRYVELKQALKAQHATDYVAYIQGKRTLINQLRAQARAWAADQGAL